MIKEIFELTKIIVAQNEKEFKLGSGNTMSWKEYKKEALKLSIEIISSVKNSLSLLRSFDDSPVFHSQGFRATRSTACLWSVVPDGTNFE